MSTKQIFRTGLMATAGLAALGLTACANSHASSNRYGASGAHYDYDGYTCGGGSDCGAYDYSSTYGQSSYGYGSAPTTALTHYDYEAVPCSSNCGASYSSGYTTDYSSSYSSGYTGTVSSYPSTTVTSSHGYASEVAPCPAGTTSQPDGTCLQSGSSYSSHVTSTYSAPVTSTYTAPVTSTYTGTTSTYVAPELTTPCCKTVSSTSTYVEPTATTTYSGYATSGSTYSSSDYLPIRK